MSVVFDDILEVTCRAEFRGVEDVVNVYQFQYVGAAPANEADVAGDLVTHMDTLYTQLLTSQSLDFVYRDITVRNTTQSSVLGVFSWPTISVGVAAAVNMPPGVGGLINMATTIARVVLRKYIAGFVSTAYEADGTLVDSVVAVLLQFGADLLDGLIVGARSYIYGHLSPKTASFEVPVSATVTDIPAYQRRRKQGRGV